VSRQIAACGQRSATTSSIQVQVEEAAQRLLVPAGRRPDEQAGVVVEAVAEPLAELRADGGAAANAWLMQFQADVLGLPVAVAPLAETTALGAAYLAGIAAGMWGEQDLDSLAGEPRRYEPRSDRAGTELLGDWRRAVDRALGWAAETGSERIP
jgi:glycerol kinase